MMASHGCGQRIGFGRSLGLAALVALSLGSLPGRASACHWHHKNGVGAELSHHGDTTSTVQSQQILSPASLVPQVPPLTPPLAPVITPTAATVPTVPSAAAPLTPSPVANPPAAEQIVPAAPPAVSAWHDASTGASSSSCGCPPPPPCSHTPVTTPPSAAEGLNPPAPLQPSAGINTPEPSTILSALMMVGAAAIYRRRARRVD